MSPNAGPGSGEDAVQLDLAEALGSQPHRQRVDEALAARLGGETNRPRTLGQEVNWASTAFTFAGA